MTVDGAIAELAGALHGVITLAQLQAVGLAPRTIQARTASGRLHRVRRGIYAVAPPALLSLHGRWLAAVLACGPGAVLSHRSAAALHGLRATSRAGIDVTVPAGSHRCHPGIDVHRSATLSPADATVVGAIPCTTVARTQLDLADVIRRRPLERVLDQAAILEVFDLRAVNAQLARNPRRAAAARLRAAVEEHMPGHTPTWSELEEALLALTRAAGLPDPEVNQFIVLDDGGPPIRVDFLWRDRRLVVETDGWATHRTKRSFERDRDNDLRLTVAGFCPVRTTWLAITRTPGQLSARLEALYRRAA